MNPYVQCSEFRALYWLSQWQSVATAETTAVQSCSRSLRYTVRFRADIMFTRLWSIRTCHEFHEIDQKKLSAREWSKMEARSRTNTERLMCEEERTKKGGGLPCITSDRARRRCYTTAPLCPCHTHECLTMPFQALVLHGRNSEISLLLLGTEEITRISPVFYAKISQVLLVWMQSDALSTARFI